MSERDPRFPRPLNDAEEVQHRTWRDGHDYAVGELIAYNHTHHDARKMRSVTLRHEGIIAELWVDRWWGDPLERLYAEVITTDDNAERVHYWRDDVGQPMGVTGHVPPNSLF